MEKYKRPNETKEWKEEQEEIREVIWRGFIFGFLACLIAGIAENGIDRQTGIKNIEEKKAIPYNWTYMRARRLEEIIMCDSIYYPLLGFSMILCQRGIIDKWVNSV